MDRKIVNYLIPIFIVSLIIFIPLFIFTAITGSETTTVASLFVLFTFYIFFIIAGTAFWIWMIVDCALRKFKEESTKIIWLLIIILTSFVGAVIYWYMYGNKPLKK